jgi:hypothetical protein
MILNPDCIITFLSINSSSSMSSAPDETVEFFYKAFMRYRFLIPSKMLLTQMGRLELFINSIRLR